MSKNVTKELPELINAGVITEEDAERIRSYYANKPSQSHSRLLVVFGILGALLVGLGIILIVAHNWDDLSRTTKTIFAFLPLITGQALCAYTLLKQKESAAWRESTAAFLFFAVGSSIALIGQIYHLSDNFENYLFTWSVLTLPLLYIMRSSIASLFYISLVTWLITQGEWDIFSVTGSSLMEVCYILLLFAAYPYYHYLYKTKPSSNYFNFHSWIIALSLLIVLTAQTSFKEDYINIAFIALFSLFSIIGRTKFFSDIPVMANAYLIVGSTGMLIQLLIFSFADAWEEHNYSYMPWQEAESYTELISAAVLVLTAAALFVTVSWKKGLRNIHPSEYLFVLYLAAFAVAETSEGGAAVIINLFLLGMGLYTIWRGAKADHLGILNFGLVILMLLVVCRFFDTELSFVLRGSMFLVVGAGFFVGNYMMLKRRKQQEARS